MSWNSIIVPYSKQTNIASKILYDNRGQAINLGKGLIQVKALICKFIGQIDTVGVVISNALTYYDLSQNKVIHIKFCLWFKFYEAHLYLQRPIKNYSPIYVFNCKGSSSETKVFQIENGTTINFCDLDEFQFQILDDSMKKVKNLEYDIHIYYQICNWNHVDKATNSQVFFNTIISSVTNIGLWLGDLLPTCNLYSLQVYANEQTYISWFI